MDRTWCVLACVLGGALAVPAAGARAAPVRDCDGDGLPELVERSIDRVTPLAIMHGPDEDADGLADALEDRDNDGRLDPGETDPRRADTDEDGVHDGDDLAPAHLEIPEPMIFDLVRGLGARAGEAEVNVLVLSGAPEHPEVLRYAPEVEVAFAHGFGVEFELPFEGTELHAVKGAIQGRIAREHGGRWMHGFQVIGEYLLGSEALDGHVLWIVSGLCTPTLAFGGMLGGRVVTNGNEVEGRGVLNASIYHALSRETWLGGELNASWDPHRDRGTVRATGQVNVSISPSFRVQLALGVEHDRHTAPVGGARIIAEL